MTDITLDRPSRKFAAGSLERQFLAVTAVTIIADWLLFDREPGISCALLAVAVCVASVMANPACGMRRLSYASLCALAGLVPLAEDVNLLSVLFAVAGTALFALLVTVQEGRHPHETVRRGASMLLVGPFRLVPDIFLFRRLVRRSRRGATGSWDLVAWVMPMVFGIAFALLFMAANPVIDRMFSSLDVSPVLESVDIFRLVFWLIVSSIAWPLIRVRFPARSRSDRPALPQDIPHDAPAHEVESRSRLFGRPAILRGLVVFNAMFAFQTGLDLVYLWGGADLPDGLSYADYAHRGAYPLIATALLAAVFVLVAMQPGSETERDPLIRALVFVWIAQNVLLVISSMFRLDLYVEVYALTHWRVAAFVWMGLVATGLVLIVARIVFKRSNGWLVTANGASLALVLYACALVNFNHIIATYNVHHSRELTGTGVELDTGYLERLGAMTLPALDTFIRYQKLQGAKLSPCLERSRDMMAQRHLDSLRADWSAWTFRGWRLARYIRRNQVGTLPADSGLTSPLG